MSENSEKILVDMICRASKHIHRHMRQELTDQVCCGIIDKIDGWHDKIMKVPRSFMLST